jgi:RNA-directed DNA polymerase
MTGLPGSNHPDGHGPVDKVRQLQRRLWVAAKRAPERRFHALMDRIWRADILWEAWRRVRRNRGAAGIDGETLADVEQYGVERMLNELAAVLRAGTYPSAAGSAAIHPEGRGPAAAARHSNSSRPSGADGGDARAGAHFRS